MRRIAVLDAPSNLGLRPPTATSVPGVYKAPGALRDHGLIAGLHARDAGCLTPPRYDPGDWRPGDGVAQSEQIAAYSRRLADRIGAIIDAGEFPVVLGGDCSIVIGSGLAMHRLGETVGGRIGLVFVDGHSDFRHPGNASYVGAAAGEDLALVTGRGQPDLAAIEQRRPYFRDVDVVVIGIRAQDEYRLDLQAAGIVTRPVPTLRVEGAARSAQWAREQLVDCAGFWVHVDVDVLDPAVMPAVDAPSPGGIALPELELLLAGLVDTPHCLGVEITVFDPDYDPDGAYAADITSALVAGLAPARTVPARPDLVAARDALEAPPIDPAADLRSFDLADSGEVADPDAGDGRPDPEAFLSEPAQTPSRLGPRVGGLAQRPDVFSPAGPAASADDAPTRPGRPGGLAERADLISSADRPSRRGGLRPRGHADRPGGPASEEGDWLGLGPRGDSDRPGGPASEESDWLGLGPRGDSDRPGGPASEEGDWLGPGPRGEADRPSGPASGESDWLGLGPRRDADRSDGPASGEGDWLGLGPRGEADRPGGLRRSGMAPPPDATDERPTSSSLGGEEDHRAAVAQREKDAEQRRAAAAADSVTLAAAGASGLDALGAESGDEAAALPAMTLLGVEESGETPALADEDDPAYLSDEDIATDELGFTDAPDPTAPVADLLRPSDIGVDPIADTTGSVESDATQRDATRSSAMQSNPEHGDAPRSDAQGGAAEGGAAEGGAAEGGAAEGGAAQGDAVGEGGAAVAGGTGKGADANYGPVIPAQAISRPLGSSPELDSEPLPATRPGRLRPREPESFSLPVQRPAFNAEADDSADIA